MSATKRKGSRLTLRTREWISGYLFMSPWIIGFFAFTLIPLIYSIYISLHTITFLPTGMKMNFVGTRWYQEAFSLDTTFTISLLNTLQFVILSTPIIVIVALIMAILLNGKFFGKTFFRVVFFFPVIVISGPVISELISNDATNIIIPGKYLIYNFLMMLPKNFIADGLLYIFDNLVVFLWFSGVQILIYLSALQKIQKSVYEAASIDGASKWQQFWKIVLPFIRPVILVNTIYTLSALASFSNNPINLEVKQKLTAQGKAYSYSSALAWIYFACILLAIGVSFLLLKENEPKKGRAK